MILTRRDMAARAGPLSKAACWTAIFLGVLAWLKWLLGDIVLPGAFFEAAIKPSSSIAIILTGVALLLLQGDVRWTGGRRIARVCGTAVGLLALLTIVEFTVGWNGAPGTPLFEGSDDVGVAMPGRMALNSAFCLLAFGLALLLLDQPILGPYPSQVLTLAGMGGAFAALVGYAYSIESLYAVTPYAPMALSSSLALIVLGVAMFSARPEQGWMLVLLGEGIGSKVARRLLPAAVLIPFLNGLLELHGERLGFYDEAFGAALMTTSGMVLFGALIWWTATSLNRDMADRHHAEQMMRESREHLERAVFERTSALMEANEALRIEVTERKHAEQAVRESETRFRAIFNQASVGIAEVRPDGRFLRVNAKFCEILGRSEQELIETTFQALTHPDDLVDNLALLYGTLEGRPDSYAMDKRYVRPDGSTVWCRLAVSLVRTSTGIPLHFISVVEDISERKRTTDALQTIVAATASVTDEDFFRPFVSHLAPALAVKYVFVGELLDGKPERVRTLAVWAAQQYGENVTYDLHGAPCEHVVNLRAACFYPKNVQAQFPHDSFLVELRAESYYGLPLLDRQGRVLGVLSVMHDQPLSLLPGMEHMLAIFAARAGIELERKRTLEALRFSDQALRQLIDEREQLAQDLHDGIIQSIYAAGLGLEEARRLVEEQSSVAVDQIKTVVGDLNSLIEDVRNHIVRKPREIKDGQHLKLALERLVRVLRTSRTIDMDAVVDRAAADRLLPGEATHIYYIAAEALSNAVRHSQARHCLMALRVVRGAVRLEVSDNGCGFDLSAAYQAGHGLRNLYGRAAKLGTHLRLGTSPGCGTRVIVDVPKESRDDHIEH